MWRIELDVKHNTDTSLLVPKRCDDRIDQGPTYLELSIVVLLFHFRHIYEPV